METPIYLLRHHISLSRGCFFHGSPHSCFPCPTALPPAPFPFIAWLSDRAMNLFHPSSLWYSASSLLCSQYFSCHSAYSLQHCSFSFCFFVRTPILNLQLHSLFYIFFKFVKLRRSLTITFQQSMWLSRQGPRLVSGTCVFNRSG